MSPSSEQTTIHLRFPVSRYMSIQTKKNKVSVRSYKPDRGEFDIRQEEGGEYLVGKNSLFSGYLNENDWLTVEHKENPVSEPEIAKAPLPLTAMDIVRVNNDNRTFRVMDIRGDRIVIYWMGREERDVKSLEDIENILMFTDTVTLRRAGPRGGDEDIMSVLSRQT